MHKIRDGEREALSPHETGLALGVGLTTVYELLKLGELESFRVGRARRIPRPSIEAFKRRNMVEQRDVAGGCHDRHT